MKKIKITLLSILSLILFLSVSMPNVVAKTTVKKTTITKCVSKAEKKILVSWKKVKKANGYQIVVSTSKKFNKVAKKVDTKYKSVQTISGLTAGKTYYVRVRVYKKNSKGKKRYSAWSTSKKVTVLNHKYKLTGNKASTCEKNGTKTYKCIYCGKKKTEKVAKKNHIYAITKKVSPSCTSAGCNVYKCKNCKKTYTKTTTKKLNHKYELISEVKANCITIGYKKYKCKTCGDLNEEYLRDGIHEYEKTKIVNPTCIEKGYTEYTCIYCKDSYTNYLDFGNHKYEITKIVNPTCTAEGYTEYTCKYCKDSYNSNYLEPISHEYEKIEQVLQTCTNQGYEKYKCKTCDDSYIEYLEAMWHEYEKVETVESTCKESGYTIYKCKYCENCYEGDYQIILPCEYIETDRVEATTESDGYVEYTCKYGKETYRETLYRIYNDKEYIVELENGETTSYVGHFVEDGMAEEIVRLMNEYRLYIANLHGSEYVELKLAEDGTPLAEAAKIRAVEIVYDFSHVRPNGYHSIASFYKEAGTIAENIAVRQKTAQEVFDSWKMSSAHNSAMTDVRHGSVGVAIFARKVDEGEYVYHFVELFAR